MTGNRHATARARTWDAAARRRRLAPAVALVGLAVPACGSGSSGLSLADRATTVSVCVQAGTAVRDAASVAVQLASTSITPSQAQQQLQAEQATVDRLAAANSSLPIGVKLKGLAAAIAMLQKQNPADPASLQQPANDLRKAAEAVLGGCAAVGK